jgi:hypothetical protein
MSAGEAVADDAMAPRARALRPEHPGEGEAILWQGRPAMLVRKLFELAGFLLLLGALTWIALQLIRPHLSGSAFAGAPNAQALPLVMVMVTGMLLIIALPVWLRSSARARARYMLTNRRALVWLGNRIAGEAILFGSEMRVSANEVSFETGNVWLDWRLRDEGADRIRFEQIGDAALVAALAEEHGARWLDRPADPAPPADEGDAPAS